MLFSLPRGKPIPGKNVRGKEKLLKWWQAGRDLGSYVYLLVLGKEEWNFRFEWLFAIVQSKRPIQQYLTKVQWRHETPGSGLPDCFPTRVQTQ